ncbi:hypothetical protein VTO42DRAFT_27 [Malbranchea cinnamomea]
MDNGKIKQSEPFYLPAAWGCGEGILRELRKNCWLRFDLSSCLSATGLSSIGRHLQCRGVVEVVWITVTRQMSEPMSSSMKREWRELMKAVYPLHKIFNQVSPNGLSALFISLQPGSCWLTGNVGHT